MYHIYTGEGKGKTTAALGQALRALGAGKKVHMLQFVKGMAYSEISVIEGLDNFTYELLGQDCFIDKKPDGEDILRAARGLEKAAHLLEEQSYDMLILDELHIAIYLGLLELQEVVRVVEKAGNTELITTGRYAPLELIERADLVTEMREIKHYYTKGIEARKGIEF